MRELNYKQEDKQIKGLFLERTALLHNFVIDNGTPKAFVEDKQTHKILLLDIKEITLL